MRSTERFIGASVDSNKVFNRRSTCLRIPSTDAGDPSIGILLRDSRLVSVLLLAFGSLLASSVVPIILSTIGSEFGVLDSNIGIVMTVFYVPQVALIPLTGIVSDIYGRRTVVFTSLAVFGFSGVAILFVDSFQMLLALRFLQGVGFAGLTPLTNVLVGDLYTGPTGSTAQGLRSSVNGVANFVAPVVAGVLASIAWNIPFLVFAVTLPIFVVVWYYLPDATEDRDEPESICITISGYGRAIRAELLERNVALLAFGGFILFFIMQAIRVYIPLLITRDIGASVFVAGIVFGTYGVIRMILSPFSGHFVAAIGRKRTLLGGLLVMAFGTALIGTASSVIWVGSSLVVYTLGEAVFNPVVNDGMAELASAEYRGGVMSSLNVLKQGANALSPVAFGLVLGAFGFTGVFLVATGIIAAFLLVLVLFLRPDP